jgi:hypothetical protein
MTAGNHPDGLELTEEEAFSLLSLCLTSPQALDAISEKALRKLAGFCISRSNHQYHLAEPEIAASTQRRAL